MAFHLAAEHPGSLLPGREGEKSESLAPTLMSYHDGTEEHEFCSLLSGNNARAIEAKIWDLLDPDHRSTMLDHTALSFIPSRPRSMAHVHHQSTLSRSAEIRSWSFPQRR